MSDASVPPSARSCVSAASRRGRRAAPPRRRAAWVAFWVLVAAFAFGCAGGGSLLDSLQWTTAVPARADLVGEWTPSDSMEETLRETWGVKSAPLRVVLAEDGTATVDGFDLFQPGTFEWRAARDSLAWGGPVATSAATWRVVVVQGGYQGVFLQTEEREVWLQMWSLSPPYSLSTHFDDADPDYGHHLFLTRRADDAVRSALAATTAPPPASVTGGDSILEVAVRIVLGAVLLLVVFCAVVLAVLALAVAVVVAIALVVAVFVALFAGGALGIAATSAVVGLARRSVAAGFRTFVTLVAAVPGAVVGAAAGWAARRIAHGPTPGATIVIDLWILVGLLVGAVLGGVVGRFAAIAVEHAARWVLARVAGPKSATAVA